MNGNPFSPTFGASPPVLAGRDEILADVDDAFETGPTHPDYTTLFVGVRGAGKTVVLNAVEDQARTRGWLTISENASPVGFVGRISRRAVALRDDLDVPEPRRRITGVSAAGMSVGIEHTPGAERSADLRSVLTALGDLLLAGGTGLLITLDELQSGDIDEVREFGAIVQHVTRREQRPIAFAGAALPQIDDTLLSDETATFLQRCSRYDIDRLSVAAVRRGLREPVLLSGGSIDPGALEMAVRATSGYAFMVQLVGFHTWKASGDPTTGIDVADVRIGIAEAERRIGRLVLAPTWKGLSEVDQQFLLAMTEDEGESTVADIATRLGVDTKYASVYRHRLINVGMIIATGRGRVDFAHHAMRQWLRNRSDDVASNSPEDGW